MEKIYIGVYRYRKGDFVITSPEEIQTGINIAIDYLLFGKVRGRIVFPNILQLWEVSNELNRMDLLWVCATYPHIAAYKTKSAILPQLLAEALE